MATTVDLPSSSSFAPSILLPLLNRMVGRLSRRCSAEQLDSRATTGKIIRRALAGIKSESAQVQPVAQLATIHTATLLPQILQLGGLCPNNKLRRSLGKGIIDMLVSRLRCFYVTRLIHLLEPEDEELSRQVEYDMHEQSKISVAYCLYVFTSLQTKNVSMQLITNVKRSN